MSDRIHPISILILFVATTIARSAAGEPALSERAAVEAAARKNPTLRAAIADVRQTAERVIAEQARYRPTLTLDASGTSGATPQLGVDGATTRSTDTTVTLGASLTQKLSWGTALELRVEGRHTRSESPIQGTNEVVTFGPGEGLAARLSVSQPLLRGFGDDVGLAQLRSAILARREKERARDEAASATLSAVLQAYWELWYAEKALAIERTARDLAEAQRAEMASRAERGRVAPVDVLTYDTRLAEREQAVLAAQLVVERSAIELARAMGEEALVSYDVSAAEPRELTTHPRDAVLDATERASYTLVALKLAVEIAEDARLTAAEATRPRLDLKAWIESAGLGNQSVTPALEQVAGLDNVRGNVGLLFELPLSGTEHEAERASAELAVEAARARLEAARQQVRAEAAAELATLDRATKNVSLAERTAAIAKTSAEARAQRFDAGAATSIEVREAEDSWRRAELAAERARADAMTAEVRLAHLTGDLLTTWGLAAED